MKIIQHRKIFYGISIILVAFSFFAIFYKGLPLGIEFTGGSMLEVSYPETHMVDGEKVPQARPTPDRIEKSYHANVSKDEQQAIGHLMIQPTQNNGFIVRTQQIEQSDLSALMNALSLDGKLAVNKVQFSFIGPTIGQELSTKAAYAIGVVIIAIILFLTYAFRHVSEPVPSWKYGVIAVTVLLHDIIIPTGIFAFLGLTLGFEINVLFVTALLAILGYSVHDTIIVFDRVRENLQYQEKQQKGKKKYTTDFFSEVVGDSLMQVLTRSINTSLTAILAILVYYFFGGESTQHFALTLAIGIFVGTYSSLCVATPLLVTAQKWQEAHPKKEDTNGEKKPV